MNLTFAYRGRSALVQGPSGLALTLAPNLRRDRVAFAGVLRQPLRFREAVSALHDIVISDLKFKPRDKTAYQKYRAEQQERENALRQSVHQAALADVAARQAEPIAPSLEADYRRLRKRYWDARVQYSNWLARQDPELWRL